MINEKEHDWNIFMHGNIDLAYDGTWKVLALCP